MLRLFVESMIGYESIPIPDSMTLPLKPGKLGLLSYQQHKSEPLTLQNIRIGHAAGNRIRINLQAHGRLDVRMFPDLNFSGTQIGLEGGLALYGMDLQVRNLRLRQLDLPKIPAQIDRLIRNIINKNAMPALAEALTMNLEPELNRAMAQINRPNHFNITVGNEELRFEFRAGVNSVKPRLTVMPEGIRLRFTLLLSPALVEVHG